MNSLTRLLTGIAPVLLLIACSSPDETAGQAAVSADEGVAVVEVDETALVPAEDPGTGFILVTGATGTQGGAVALDLLSRGFEVHGLTRNPESERAQALTDLGVVMVRGDFDDADSLAAAMDGAYGVFAVTDFWEHGYDQEVAHGEQLVDAALRAGVRHFVYTSVADGPGSDQLPHFASKYEVEDYLAGSGLPFSIVRPVEFMDNWRYAKDMILSGQYIDPRSPEKSHQWIAASDIGFFVGEAFANPSDWLGQTVEIAGDQMQLSELVDMLSDITDRPVVYEQISWDDFEAESGEEMTAMLRWFDEPGYSVDIEGLRAEYPDLVTVEEFLSQMDWSN